MVDNIKLIDRFEGCLVGGAVGDALGYPVEFMSYDAICAQFGPQGIEDYWLEETGGVALFSDDTQMTLFSAAGLVRAGGAADWARYTSSIYKTYLDWLRTQRQSYTGGTHGNWLLDVPELYSRRAPGNTCLSALGSRRMGLMEEPLNNSKGCGGVMRVAPMGLFFDDPDEAAHIAAVAAAITHGHPMGYIPAAALAFIVNRCTYGENVALADIVEECIECLPGWFEEERFLAEDMGRQLREALDLARAAGADEANIRRLGEGWVGDQALAISVYAALRHEGDFSQTVIAAVNHDGDADSTGAIAGNIAGAQLGLAKIDQRWLDNLELLDVIKRSAQELYEMCKA